MCKILHIIQTMKRGGAQRTLLNIVKSTPKFNHYVYSSNNEWQLSNIELTYINSIENDFLESVNQIRPEIVHYHWWPGCKLIHGKILSKLNVKYIISIQDPEESIVDVGADRYIACSEYTKNVQQNIEMSKISVVYNYIDINDFDIRRIETNEINLVRHSTIYPNKINTEILDMIIQLTRDCQKICSKKVRFIICGDGDNELIDNLKKHLIMKNANSFVEFWDGSRISEMLSKADVFNYFTPSDSIEGCANVIYEAFAFRIPVVADKKGGNIEQVIDDINGYKFSNYNELLQANLKILLDENNKREIGENNHNFILSNNIAKMGEMYSAEYTKLL